MTRPVFKLSTIQKQIIERSNKEWYNGDDNDFSCWLSSVQMDAYKAGLFDYAFYIHRNDPMARDMARDEFLDAMKSRIAASKDWEIVYEAHARAVGQAG